jgi:hypothetical protein
MIISVKSSEYRELKLIEQKGSWQRKFMWFPAQLKCEKGIKQIVWLTFVHRKAIIGVWMNQDQRYRSNFHYQYSMADEAFMHALEHGNALAFSSSEAIEYYQNLKEICNE